MTFPKIDPSRREGSARVYQYDLLRELVIRDLKLRYKRSMLGIAWSLLNPLAQLLVFTFVFTRVLPLDRPNFSSFLFCGLLAWTWFQSSLVGATGSITDNRELIRRPGFPVAILPVVRVTSDLLHFLLGLPILVGFLAMNGFVPSVALLALPLVIAAQFVLILSLAYIVATIHVTFRDTQYLLGVFLMLLFYVTPVFYGREAVPERFQTIYSLNPILQLIEGYRAIFLTGSFPDFVALGILGTVSGTLLYLGYRFFVNASWHFVEEL